MKRPPKSLVGLKVGKLTVVKFSHQSASGLYCWETQCECGNPRIISTSELNRGRAAVLSCGCSKYKRSLVGNKYGSLTALKISHKRGYRYYWLCKCDCGNEKSIAEECLTRGNTLTCGCSRQYRRLLLISRTKERLVENMKVTPEGCWDWQRGKDKNGYGTCGMGYGDQRAHRSSYRVFKGSIPKGMFVCHHCDNPSCINPEHLFLGTNKDNILDASSKGRLAVGPDKRKGSLGEKNRKAKLNDDKVKCIRFLCDNGYKKSEIANFFGVYKSSIESIARRKTWSHI
jgi:hypothetical protein